MVDQLISTDLYINKSLQHSQREAKFNSEVYVF